MKTTKSLLLLIILILALTGCLANPSETPTLESESAPPVSTEKTPTPVISTDISPMEPSPQVWRYYMEDRIVYRADESSGAVIQITTDFYSDMIITDEWVYFYDGGCLYKMGQDNERQLLSEDNSSNLALRDDWLYYSNADGVFRIKTDGLEKEQLVDDVCYGIALSDSYIFYTRAVPYDDSYYVDDRPPRPLGGLHRMDFNGKNDKYLGIIVNYIDTYKNRIYYSECEDFRYFEMDPETLKSRVVYDGYFIESPCFGGDYAFFISDRRVHKVSLLDASVIELTDAYWASSTKTLDGYVYYHLGSAEPGIDGYYKMKIDGDEWELVSADSITINGIEQATLESKGEMLSVDEAQALLINWCEWNAISYMPEMDKHADGIQLYGFLVDYTDRWSEWSADTYCYAWVNSSTGRINFEEAGYSESAGSNLYGNIPDSMFPIPMLDGEVIHYDRFAPPEYVWGVTYFYDDKSVMETYQAQLREAGFVDCGTVQSVESLWQYKRSDDGAVFSVEMYGEGGKFSMNMYCNYF